MEKSVAPQVEGYVVVLPKALSMKKLAVLFFAALMPIYSFAETMFLTASLNAAGSLLTGIYAAPSVELAEQSGSMGLWISGSVLVLPPVAVYAGPSPGALNPVFNCSHK